MKKLFTILFCLLAIVANAEVKMALLQPRVAEGSDACRPIELNMVRGELRKAFGWQSDFQVLTRTDVDQMLKELGFQQSGMVDDNQRKKVGEMTGAQYICVSTITKDGTQLYIESYLVNVETGQMTNPATQYANVLNNDYSTLQNPCNELAKEMLGELGGVPQKSVQVETSNKPVSPVANDKPINQVPDNKSLEEPEGYVDLGLPSGTLWKAQNEPCGTIEHDKAMSMYGNNLPTKEQFEELINSCVWIWTGKGYNVMGPNNKTIFLSFGGGGKLKECYLSSTSCNETQVYAVFKVKNEKQAAKVKGYIESSGGVFSGLYISSKSYKLGIAFGVMDGSVRLVK